MFAESPLYTDINEGGYLSHGKNLLCDSGYTCSKFTINVVPNKRITHVEKQFNKAHRIARSCIERAFGQLKGHDGGDLPLSTSISPTGMLSCQFLSLAFCIIFVSREEKRHLNQSRMTTIQNMWEMMTWS